VIQSKQAPRAADTVSKIYTHTHTYTQDICDSIVAGAARSRHSLKDTLNRLGRDSQSLVDDIITEFRLLSREISEGVLHGEDSFELRIARDMVSFPPFF